MLWTRELLIRDEGDPREDFRRVCRVYREATNAKDEYGPDHSARIAGANGLSRLYGFDAPKQLEPGDPTRPVQVAIILTGAEPRAALPAGGVAIHLAGDYNGGG